MCKTCFSEYIRQSIAMVTTFYCKILLGGITSSYLKMLFKIASRIALVFNMFFQELPFIVYLEPSITCLS